MITHRARKVSPLFDVTVNTEPSLEMELIGVFSRITALCEEAAVFR